jgi:NAD-dependent SIR2 family protein deacetylase
VRVQVPFRTLEVKNKLRIGHVIGSLDPAVDYAIAQTRQLLFGLNVLAMTGAGVSTDSGIPDYRGQGRVVRHPLTFDQFLASEENQARYWARSYVGWNRIASAEPNHSHLALARAEQTGQIQQLITQNVDGLHQKAGSKNVIELHGRLDRVVCLDCTDSISRQVMDGLIQAANPSIDRRANIEFTPDGDAEIDVPDDFKVPTCQNCNGRYKPDVVFFGEQIPQLRITEAKTAVERADAVLVAGSSLAVNSGLRLVKQAKELGQKIVIINRGETKADNIADVKLNASAADVLRALFL